MLSLQRFKVITAGAIILLATGCASTKQYKVQEEAKDDSSVLNQVPAWYIDHDVDKGLVKNRDADEFIYGVGSAVSADLQLAMEKALLAAKADLADQLAGVINKSTEVFIAEGSESEGTASLASRAESTTVNTVTDMRVTGYHEWNKAVYVTRNDTYRVYVGLRWTQSNQNRLQEYIDNPSNRPRTQTISYVEPIIEVN